MLTSLTERRRCVGRGALAQAENHLPYLRPASPGSRPYSGGSGVAEISDLPPVP